MDMRNVVSRPRARFALAGLLLAASHAAFAAQPTLPRKAPEFTITEPNGNKTLLSSYKGKVVVLTFIYTTCIHCQHETELVTKIYNDWKSRGLEAAGVAFNDNPKVLVPAFVQQFRVPYPIGYSDPDPVIAFQGFTIMDRYTVPQIAIIDRKGMIRAQSGPMGDPLLQEETSLRRLLDSLLKEGADAGAAKKAAPKKAS
jgi:peroxiredoxin